MNLIRLIHKLYKFVVYKFSKVMMFINIDKLNVKLYLIYSNVSLINEIYNMCYI